MRTRSSFPYEPTSTVVCQTSWRTQHLMKEHLCSKKSFHINTHNVRVKLTFGSSAKRSQKKKKGSPKKIWIIIPHVPGHELWTDFTTWVVLPGRVERRAQLWRASCAASSVPGCGLGSESELEGAPFLFHVVTGTWLGPTQHHQRCFEDPSCHQIWVTHSLLTHRSWHQQGMQPSRAKL